MKKPSKELAMGLALGTVLTATVLTSAPALASTARKSIDVVYNNIKLVVDGREVTPTDANGKTVEPFIYEGTTYLPVRAAANAISNGTKPVDWDQTSATIYIGEKPTATSAMDMSTLKPISGPGFKAEPRTFMNRQTEIAPQNHLQSSSTFLLGGKYQSLQGMWMLDDASEYSSVELILSDADTKKELGRFTAKQMEAAVPISVNVTGVDKLRIDRNKGGGICYNATLTPLG